jgi:hypothetical protein
MAQAYEVKRAQLHVPDLQELAELLQEGLKAYYKNVRSTVLCD